MTRVRALVLTTVIGASLLAAAQQVGTNSTADRNADYTFRANSQLIIENIIVKDKKGNFIDGLTAKDFAVNEDGVRQAIRFCEHQKLSSATPLPITPTGEEDITIYKTLERTQIAPEQPSSAQYRDHRLISLYFDLTAMPPEDQMRALAAASKFVRTQMTSADLISIMRYAGGSVDVLQDFTVDRNRLLSILQTLIVGEGQGSAESISDASSADTGAAFGQDDSEFNIFTTDRQLAALETAAKMLGQTSEKKLLIYFASGLRLNGIDNQAQLHATIDAAIRAGVSYWMIDARGLVAQAPIGDASQSSPGTVDVYSGNAEQVASDMFQQSQDTMYALAADTGGKAFFDNNDLVRGIVQAQTSISDYYTLGYYTTNTAQNGHFRRVDIKVDPALRAKLDYRHGYYANKEFSRFTAVDRERQLEEALMVGDPITDLTIAMEIDYFQLNRAEYFVPFVVKIPGRELALAKRFGSEHTLIDFVCEVKDLVGGVTVSNLRDSINVKLPNATAAEPARLPIEYDSGFTLFPGKYSIKFLARDDETGRIGTYQTTFVIPNLVKETRRVPISSVVLSSQHVDTNRALYTVMRGKTEAKELAANPLVKNGIKLIPSVTRVFSARRSLNVFVQTYHENATTTPAAPIPSLIAYVGLYRDGKNVLETPPKVATAEPESRLGTTPISFSIKLDGIALGRYDCQVTILDPTEDKVAFWVSPIIVDP
jgi:VWFA-related protein